MKSGLKFYNRDIAYRMLKKRVVQKYGKKKTKQIWRRAGKCLEYLWEKYRDVSKEEKRHTHNNIFPRIAMYRVLEKEYPQEAMEIMDFAVEHTGKYAGKLFGVFTAIPLMPSIFLRIFAYMTKKMFGPSAGFEQVFYEADGKVLRFDITKCPYCKYCKKCGCPELTHTFCDSDIYCYGNLPGIEFARTQTLGTGGTCCDFSLRVGGKIYEK